ncbi:RNA recognition motif domain [Macleaya cordata]|uniref:RNA recognition motif domain n=1 Tax=Macleaya cordata TaxID=56857 RepID=A0A200Q2G2_MACCD|nr:RNA recognition motif domain [Macleaya cordata]
MEFFNDALVDEDGDSDAEDTEDCKVATGPTEVWGGGGGGGKMVLTWWWRWGDGGNGGGGGGGRSSKKNPRSEKWTHCSSMAEHLASIFGTEKDRVNCPFYFKIGACRHGDRCSRLHTRPSISPTLLLSNMYQRPDMMTPGMDPQGHAMDPRKIQEHFEDFYEDLFEELSKYGEIESLNICDNLADHMVGNVYVQFREEEHAANALKNLTGRYYAGRPIIVDFSPVTDFREATCRQYEENTCNRGGYCNFMHLKKISRELRRQLFGRYRRRHSRSRSRSRSPYRHRSHEERSHGGRGYDRRYDDRDYHSHDDRSSRRTRSRSPGRRRGRSRSPGGKRIRSPVREGSAERRAKIEQWNREKEQTESGHNNNTNATNINNNDSSGYGAQNGDQYYEQQQQPHRGGYDHGSY